MVDLNFPNNVQTSASEELIRVEGTKVSAMIPEDYSYIAELARYQKDAKTYFQVIETTSSSFTEAKPTFTRAAIEAQGAKIDLLKDISFNQYDGIFGVGPSKYPGESKLMFIFGDDTFIVMIVAVCKTDDEIGAIELTNIFQSVYYDKSFQLNSLELANFTFDESITGFKHTETISNFFIYSQEGEEQDDPFAQSFQFGAMPLMNDSKAKEFANDLLWRYEKSGMLLHDKEIVKTQIGKYDAFVLETAVTLEKKEGTLYQVLLIGDESCVLFVANVFDNIDTYLPKYKETVQTVVIK